MEVVDGEKLRLEVQNRIGEEKIQTGGSNIQWKDFEPAENQYVKLVVGKPKVLTLESVRQTTEAIVKRDKSGNITGEKQVPALKFRVSKEDGQPCDKEFTVTSKVLARQFKGIIEKGLPATIKITKYGVGFDTTYELEYMG